VSNDPTTDHDDERLVRYEVADRVATVTLDRPEARNALSSGLRRMLPRVMARADADP
jgi:enoyl-CoA hydratase